MVTSFLGAFVAGGAWCLLTIAGVGHFGLFINHPLIASGSFLVLLSLSALPAIFVYRHTARRRKTQALLAMVVTLLLTFGMYVTMMRFLEPRLSFVGLPGFITQPLRARLSVPIRFLSARALTIRSQNECDRPIRRPTPARPGKCHRD